ncbi:MAG: hypothetical protein HZB55_15420 [Deltaproteobacteria bacterium]|nr:hypothetical protein [Deltaproteobacteria bacterium]
MPEQVRGRLRQLWFVAFVLGALLINYPFLHIFNRPTTLGGLPVLFLYFFVGWAASIAVIAFYTRALKRLPPNGQGW